MKKLILSLLLFTFAISFAAAQNPAVRDFIREHRKGEENVALKIPGWMIGLASEVGMLASDDEEEEGGTQPEAPPQKVVVFGGGV